MMENGRIEKAIAELHDSDHYPEAAIFEVVYRERNDCAGTATLYRGLLELDAKIIGNMASALRAIADHQEGVLLDFYARPEECGRPIPPDAMDTTAKADPGPLLAPCSHPFHAVYWNPRSGVVQCHRCGEPVDMRAPATPEVTE